MILFGIKNLLCKIFEQKKKKFSKPNCDFFSSNLSKKDDDLHIHVYDDDIGGRDSVGSAKIDLKKHVFGKGRYEEWVKLPGMLGLRSKGEVLIIIEHRVRNSHFFFLS